MINKYLDLSTAHVEEGFNKLDFPFRVQDHEHGWIIFVPGELDEEAREKLQEQNAEYLITLIEYAIKVECLIINLDSDGDTIEDLKTFKW